MSLHINRMCFTNNIHDIRENWTHEEYDFTPWVADHLTSETSSELEDVIGLNLELIKQEKSVDKYNVDIFDRVTEARRNIVVEIEFERSAHDYLGKSITYAADVDLAVTEFRLANIYYD